MWPIATGSSCKAFGSPDAFADTATPIYGRLLDASGLAMQGQRKRVPAERRWPWHVPAALIAQRSARPVSPGTSGAMPGYYRITIAGSDTAFYKAARRRHGQRLAAQLGPGWKSEGALRPLRSMS